MKLFFLLFPYIFAWAFIFEQSYLYEETIKMEAFLCACCEINRLLIVVAFFLFPFKMFDKYGV